MAAMDPQAGSVVSTDQIIRQVMSDTEVPDYVCCVLTESTWTWFGATLLTVLFLTLGTLKYCKRYLASSKFAMKNQRLLAKQLVEYGREALSILRLDPVPESEFLKYCALRRRHSAIIDKLEFAKTVKFQEDEGQSFKKMSSQENQCDVPNGIQIYGRRPGDRRWVVVDGLDVDNVNAFWLSVWHLDAPIIVMLTKAFEIVKLLCVQYWPNDIGTTETYGQVQVSLMRQRSYAHYKIREIRMRKDGAEKVLQHFQYLDWPASAQPDTTSLLHFWRRVNEYLLEADALPGIEKVGIIHCTSAKRRSGTFLALDFILNERDLFKCLDVLGVVRWLRSQNPCLVPSPEQYHFIYDLVEDTVMCGSTRVQVPAIPPDADSAPLLECHLLDRQYEREYAILCSVKANYSLGDCAAGHRVDNRHKNRNALVTPPDERRPYLTSFQSNNHSDYINAVFIDGFLIERQFIATEWPMDNTAENFWCMVYDHDVTCVVVLNGPPSKILSKKFVQFWPTASYGDAKLKQFGPVFSVEVVSKEEDAEEDVAVWHLHVRKKVVAPHRKNQAMNVDEKQGSHVTSLSRLLSSLETPVKKTMLIQLRKSWPQHQLVPESPGPLLSVIDKMRQRRRILQLNKIRPTKCDPDDGGRVAVVSRDGISRIGIFCTAAHSIEKVDDLRRFDIFQSAKVVRRSRPQLVNNLSEYKFCYQMLANYTNLTLYPSV